MVDKTATCQLCEGLECLPEGVEIIACPACAEVKIERRTLYLSGVCLYSLRELLNRGWVYHEFIPDF